MECDRNCHNCPFQVDPYDPDRRVCIKCGREYSFRRTDLGNFIVPVLLTIFIVALLDQSSPEVHPQSVPPQQARQIQ